MSVIRRLPLIAVLVIVTLAIQPAWAGSSALPAQAAQDPSAVAAPALTPAAPVPPAPRPGQGLLDAVRQGKWPSQTAASTGAIRPNPHGPQRTDTSTTLSTGPAEGIPVHAYSPFDERRNREYPCPPGGCEFMKGQLLVKLAPQTQPLPRREQSAGRLTDDRELDRALAAQGIVALEPIFPNAQPPKPGALAMTPDGAAIPLPDLTRWHRAALADASGDVYAVAESLAQLPGIAWAEPDYLRKPVGEQRSGGAEEQGSRGESQLPASSFQLPASSFTDPLYAQQWHLAATNVPQAWDWLASQGLPAGGNRDIVVAVIDTGVDYNHPDLAANIWVNAAEFNGLPGVDDDGNGYVDDVHGADMITNSGNPLDDHGHGTHVAGIIAAQAGNGAGGVGVTYNVQVMAIKAAQYSGVLASSDIAEGIYYAAAQGADVINMSFGGYSRSQLEEDALAVAFGQAVLVAAAGNDAKVNLPCQYGRDMYPAAYNWVLGVMARQQNPDAQGDYLAGFSNYDCTAQDSHEYELMAPGVDVWSTLPNGQYAAWDGTSMAAPVVSGIAALARTKWSDKDVYSSRFIMGQLATTGGLMQGYTPLGGSPVSYYVPNAFLALTTVPQPKLSYLEHWTFDTADQSAINDDDGIVDAGETIDLAIVIRNHWGKADPVTVTLEAWAAGAYQPDPYVTMITGTVDYGAVGSFNIDDNGLIYDDQGIITGVRNPFRFIISPDCPNNHSVPFLLTMTTRNGSDPTDTTIYQFSSRFNIAVQRGIQVSGEIERDTLWTKDHYYIVTGNLHIPQGVTLTIEPGTTVALDPDKYIVVEGTLRSVGTADNRIRITSNSAGKWGTIVLYNSVTDNEIAYTDIENGGAYVGLFSTSNWGASIWVAYSLLDIHHCVFFNNTVGINLGVGGDSPDSRTRIHHNHFRHNGDALRVGYVDGVLLDFNTLVDNGSAISKSSSGRDMELSMHNSNIFANTGYEIYAWTSDSWSSIDATGNYWGTVNRDQIAEQIWDYYDTFSGGKVSFEPFLTHPDPNAPPVLYQVELSPSSPVGVETIELILTFSRDMDTSMEPFVTFGPSEPYTDHRISGTWTGPRTWEGAYTVTPSTGDGWQTIYVTDASESLDRMGMSPDTRFRFEIITSGTESMNLQATGGEGYVDLTWTQTDFDLLSGFNLYRATTQDGSYSRINTGIIPPATRDYTDTAVTPGQPYFYKFTVVKSDMTESDFSNVATATPLDTIPPVVVHTPVTSAAPGLALTLYADVTDNVAVQAVSLHYRAIGATSYLSRTMTLTTGNRYSATIEGSRVTSPGLEYYIEATDGISRARAGRADFPYQVAVVDRPVVTAVSPNRGPSSGGTAVTIGGSNFKAGATVVFGAAAASDVTVVSSSQITCTTPPHYPEAADVTVTNPDGQSGTLLRGFTFESDTATLGLPDTAAEQHAVVEVPVNLANVGGLLAADLTISFDAGVLQAQGARTGNLIPGWSLQTNTGTPGQARLSMASPGGSITGAGVLVYLQFEVLGSAGVTSTLHVASASLNDGAIPVQLTDGVFTVHLAYGVAGAVRYWSGGAGVPGVTLSLVGDYVYTGVSDPTGAYTVTGARRDGYVLTPGKSDAANGITAYDASLALQHAAGLITLTGDAATAADVNRSGLISSMDASYILQRAVGLIGLPFPGAGIVWQFNPASRSYDDLSSNQTGQDFTAILLGDVSGNWSAGSASARSNDFSRSPVTVRVRNAGASATIWLDPAGAPIYSLELLLTYPVDQAEVLAVEPGPAARGLELTTNRAEPGRIRIAMAGGRPVTQAGALLTIRLRPTTGARPALALAWGEVNEGAAPARLVEGWRSYLPAFGGGGR